MYRKRCLGKLHAFVTSKDNDNLELAPAILIWNRDPFMWTRKKVRVPPAQLEKSDKVDEDEEEIRIPTPRFTRKTSLPKPDPRGKTIATSPEKTKKSEEP